MKLLTFVLPLLLCLSFSISAQNDLLCVGRYWTEDEANVMMKQFAAEWDDLESWHQRADLIKKGIKEGMQWNKMPKINGNFHPIIHSTR
ncbi:MAG: hypothetical protein R2824_03140 [Saprospiraceae bacterium]|nr:hypothetical protein [Lewinella sp.]